MRFSLGKVRMAVLALLLLLLGGVAGFVLYGRRLASRMVRALPRQLARELLQESFHVSYSHSEHGKTVFTVHAAKEQKWTSGLITLDDVGIELYGRQDGAPDRIHGSKFEFNQDKGLLTAVGDVYIDLAGAPGRDGSTAESRALHVKTSGLVFNQKTRVADTDAAIEFQNAELTGTAVGAEYDSERNVLVLRSVVRIHGVRNGQPVLLTAAHAEIDRTDNVAELRDAAYSSPGESLRAASAHILLTDGGAARAVEAQGSVVLTGEGRGTLTGDDLQASLGEDGKLQQAHLWGAVKYTDREPGRETNGTAADLRVQFSTAGAAEHAVVTGGVVLGSRSPGLVRLLNAQKLELSLAGTGAGQSALRHATATGEAVLRTERTAGNGPGSDEVRADVLNADFAGAGSTARVTRLVGTGHTAVDQVQAATGIREQTVGDSLEADFQGEGRQLAVSHASQSGGFRLVRTVPGKGVTGRPGEAPQVERAQATQATYDGATDRMHLLGAVQVTGAGDVLQADQVTLDHTSGDAEAAGNVRATYTPPDEKGPAAEPVHILAARAEEHKAAGTAEFFGPAAGGDARMAQGGSQVFAPVLLLSRAQRTLVAQGAPGVAETAQAVRTLLVNSSAGKPEAKTSGTVLVLSHTLHYSDSQRQAVFSGPVRLHNADGVLTAQEMTVYLLPAGAPGQKPTAGAPPALPTGQVDRIVAQGDVRLLEADRHAQGDRLLYTASDRTFVLTGTPSERPSMTDEAQGTITGRLLRFHSGDQSVQVEGGEGEAGRVRSDLRVKQR